MSTDIISKKIIFKDFKASEVPLSGSNLIEASAGTGKTYSIAILVLRLLLEKSISIKEILMVTFTKAAAAELEERIRLFIRSAYLVSKGGSIEDTTITSLVKISIAKTSNKNVAGLLKDAIIYLDETSVLTIHSFCQKTLSEFAFETHQLFGAELMQDTSELIETEVNSFWRKYVTSIPIELLTAMDNGLSRDDIKNIVKTHLDGKSYHEFDPFQEYFLDAVLYDRTIKNLNEIAIKYVAEQLILLQYIGDNTETHRTKCTDNTYARRGLLHLVDNHQDFLNAVIEKRGSAYIPKLFQNILDRFDECEKCNTEKDNCIQECLNAIYYLAIAEVTAGVKKFKLQNNKVTFDDFITNLHTALVKKDNIKLAGALQNKFKAVFIDEFQDTDKMQYEVFNKAFGGNTVLFYIGDPKQSIFAWRKADIATYFSAYNNAENCYGMNENYRSSEDYIKAMNVFFQPTPNFDTFHFGLNNQAITYIPVNSPADNTKGNLKFGDSNCIPISINEQPNKQVIEIAVTAQVIDLLTNEAYTIFKNNSARKILPSDIGILVRSNTEGNSIKAALAKYGIPAVTIGDAKVLESNEAQQVLYILEAMMDLSRSSINKALLCSFTGFGTSDILILDDEVPLELFKKYKASWDKDGIYNALTDFMTDFGVAEILLHNNTENGERTITNLFQLKELLYKIQTIKNLSPTELISWLRRGIESNDATGDEYEQRIENDEVCVKIVTIHKSKGLEYNIVLAPYLDIMERKKDTFCSFKNEHGEYVNLRKDKLTSDQSLLFKQQAEQENRRLVYVAITRAVYKCFIFKNTSGQANPSTLSFFTTAITDFDNGLIEKCTDVEIAAGFFFKNIAPPVNIKTIAPVNFTLTHNNWQRMSYTMLAAETEKKSKTSTGNLGNEYDEFIFKQLTKGSKTGNMLHHILENINFSNNENWPIHIDNAIREFNPSLRNEFEPKLLEMLQQILEANITMGETSFTLEQVGFNDRIHEFEFDFPVDNFDTSALQAVATDTLNIHVKDRREIEGIMNGKIDMLFQCQGKYFILDWKSTFLGDTLAANAPDVLTEAMSENNYHLQYLIYTLATKKYLETRLPDFDYERDFGGVLYLFVRGMRKGTDYGVFNCKPSLEQIEQLEAIFLKKEKV